MGLSLKEISELSFEEILNRVEKGELAEPVIFTLYLDNARDNYLLEISGNYFAIIDASHTSANISVKFNRQDAYAWIFEKGLALRRPFKRFWVTHSAQLGMWIKILCGTLSPQLLEIIDNRIALLQQQVLEQIRDDQRSTISSGNAEITVGNVSEVTLLSANANRKCLSIQAKDTNTGIIYILYQTGVSSTKYKAILQAGQLYSDDKWRGIVVAIASAAGQLCCAQEEV